MRLGLVDVSLLLDARLLRTAHFVEVELVLVSQAGAALLLVGLDLRFLLLQVVDETGEVGYVTAFQLENAHLSRSDRVVQRRAFGKALF